MTNRDAVNWENQRDEQREDPVWLRSSAIKISVIQSDSEDCESYAPALEAEFPGLEPDRDLDVEQPLVPIPAEPAATSGSKRREQSPVWVALLLSGMVHGALFVVLQSHRSGTEIAVTATPANVRINLLPSPATRAETAETTANTGRGTNPPAPLEAVAEPEPTAVPDAARDVIAPSASAPEAPAVAEFSFPEPDVSRLVERPEPRPGAGTTLVMPTVAAVRNEVQQMQAASQARAWQRDCSERQERSELLDCGPDDGPTYSADPGKTIYRALNPVREASRAQRSLPTVAANLDGLAERLTAAGIPADRSDYLLQQTGVTITEGSDTGNRAVRHLNLMSERSAAAGWGRELLNDPWIMQRARQLEQRKVVER